MFVRPVAHHPTTFASDLGCQLDEQGLIKLDALGRTTVSGVYAAGDISNPRRSIALSVAQGVSAGHVINYDLMTERFA
jgi:thioredoxin reductase